MSVDLDFCSMLLEEDLELFPGSLLPKDLDEDGPNPPPPSHSHPQASQHQAHFPTDTHHDQFPNWLDLKVDLSFLEGLENSDYVFDDLLQSEANVGQFQDVPQALQVEDTLSPPLDFKQPPSEQISTNVQFPKVTGDLDFKAGSCSSVPPSPPECLVPEMIAPDSPTCLESLVPDPASSDCTLLHCMTSLQTPDPANATLIAFLTPVVQPLSTVDIAIEAQCLPLDVPHLGDEYGTAPPDVQMSLPEICSPVPTVSEKRTNCKRKANSKMSLVNLKRSKPSDDDAKSLLSVPTLKKERKRQQNKDAALRYRLKKKLETDSAAVEEKEVLEQNKKLREEAQHLAKELGYLKKLLREMFTAKGLLK